MEISRAFHSRIRQAAMFSNSIILLILNKNINNFQQQDAKRVIDAGFLLADEFLKKVESDMPESMKDEFYND
jgi:hypothetical protein